AARLRHDGWARHQKLVHPILDDRRRLAIYLLAWLLIGLLLVSGLSGDNAWLTAATFFLPLVLVYSFVSLSSWYVCRAFPIDGRSGVPRVVAVHVAVAALASAIWVVIAAAWTTAIDSLTGLDTGRLYAEQRALLFVVGALMFWLATVFHYLLIAVEASREAQTRALELSLLAREAELKALRAQIDP